MSTAATPKEFPHVAMAPGTRRLAVAVRDDVGRTMAAVKRELKLIDG